MSGTRRPLLAGNWKMHLTHLEAIGLVQKLAFTLRDEDYDRADVVVLPPFTALRSVQTLIEGDNLRIGFGAQDLSPHQSGAYTGDVSGPMLRRLGCRYVVVGHSERRQQHGETDQLVAAKAGAAFAADLVPIVCVGEDLPVRRAGGQEAHTLAQLDPVLEVLTGEQAARLVVAYEPVWAIGSGEVATPQDAAQVCSALRRRIRGRHGGPAAHGARLLYGGSVKADNVAGIMAADQVDGALVGGASLDPAEFARIVRFDRPA